MIDFTAQIMKHPDMDAAYVEFPFDTFEIFGKKGHIKVKAVFDGTVEYRGSLVKMGSEHHCLGVRKDIRKMLNKRPGDQLFVQLEEDVEERTVSVAPDILSVLAENPEAKGKFDKMSHTQRKEFINWIEDAKKPETREKRKIKLVALILTGKKGL